MQHVIRLKLILFVAIVLALLIRTQDLQITVTQAKGLSQSPQSEAEDLTQQAQSARLAAQSTQMLNDTYDNLVRSILLATESMRRLPTVEGNIALRESMSLLPHLISYTDFEENIYIGAFTPDLSRLATARDGAIVEIWNMTTGQAIVEMHHDSGQIWSMTFSQDANLLATGGSDETARVWNAATGQEIFQINVGSNVNAVSFSTDNEWVATGSSDDTARIWKIKTGQEVAQFLHEEYINAVALSPDSKWLATTSGDGMAHIWDIVTGEKLNQSASGSVDFMKFTADGRLLVTSNTNQVNIWNVRGRIKAVIQEIGIEVVALSPDGRWLATGNGDGQFRIWETNTGKKIGGPMQLPDGGRSSIALAFHEDGQQLGIGHFYGPISIWQIDPLPGIVLKTGHDVTINDFAFSPDNSWLAVANDDNTAQILNIANPGESILLSHNKWVNQVAFSSDNRQVATASSDGIARIWDVNTGKEVLQISPEPFITQDGSERIWPINTVTFSPNNKQLVTGSDDSTIRIWDAVTGSEMARIEYEPVVADSGVGNQITTTQVIRDVRFSPDGKWLKAKSAYSIVTISSEPTRIWDTSTWEEVPDSAISVFDLSNDEASALYYSDQISPDRNFIVHSYTNRRYNEGSAYISGAGVKTIIDLPLENVIFDTIFSPDSQWLAVRANRSNDTPDYFKTAVWVFDSLTGRPIIFLDDEGIIQDIVFSPDGRWLAASSSTGHIHLLTIKPDDLIAEACTRLPRNLTQQEWQQYLGDEPYRATCPNLPILEK